MTLIPLPPASALLDKRASRLRRRKQAAQAILAASLRYANYAVLGFRPTPALRRELEALGYTFFYCCGQVAVRWEIVQ